ncbi:hup2 [Scenedesmus sp. PABB004]|nr:hup2 [Scenedesmus sp. PABB004]
MAFLLSRNGVLLGRTLASGGVARRVGTLAPPVGAAKAKEASATVGKAVLAKRLAEERPNLSVKEATDIIDALLDDIMLSVAEGNAVTIPGFGSFKKRTRAARKGRNPKTGEEISIPATDSPAFSAGTVFKGVVKSGSWEAFEAAAAAAKAAKKK